jgi:ribulose-phosphate 3-epimerase
MIIAPSIWSADLTKLGEQVSECEAAGADWLHIDVMDGQFVPNISVGPVVVEAIRRVTTLPLDVHLMIVQPERYLSAFADAGADHLTVHIEACPDLPAVLQKIKGLGKKAGVAFNPETPASAIEAYLAEADIVLPMSVHPGFSGQKFIPETLPKIQQLRAWIDARGLKTEIEVDGGIDGETGTQAHAAGASAFVAASAIFKHRDGIAAGIHTLANKLNGIDK